MTLPPRPNRVLMIGDDSVSSGSIIGALEDRDPRVEIRHAADALAACVECGRSIPDLVLVDLDLLGADAGRLITAVRKASDRSRVVGLAQSDESIPALVRAGCDHVFSRSLPQAALTRAIESMLATDGRSTAGDTLCALLVEAENESGAEIALGGSREPSFDVTRVGQLERALDALDRFAFDVALVDLDFHGANGPDALGRLRSAMHGLPVIVMGGNDSPDIDVVAIRNGAQDYVRKPVLDPRELVRIVIRSIERRRIALALECAHRRERFLATHDGVTGLCNRALFHDRLEQALAVAARDGQTAALLRLDVDRFKSLNEAHGHAIGDELLRHIGSRLTTCARNSDLVARLGDDEFVLLLRNLRRVEDAARVAESVLQVLTEPYGLGAHEIGLSTSIGIALFPDDCGEAQILLREADVALQHVKTSGGNDYRFFTRDLECRVRERRVTDAAIRKALESDQFVVHYQPLIDLRTEMIFGVEALVRWNHPERGLIQPPDFIPHAEELGLIGPISEWVLERATSQHRAWRDSGLPGIRLAVNISVDQLLQRDLPQKVVRVLDAARMAPEQLELEITESGILRDDRRSLRTLDGLKRLGVRISLDDFGTGQASLSYLRKFPADTVKLDRSYVCQLGESESDTAIATAILALAESLHLDTIAEGVETTAQLEFLAGRRCHRVQGFLFSGALPEPAIRERLRDGAAALIGGARAASFAGRSLQPFPR